MSSHHDWADEVIALHEQKKPFAPENGQPLQFKAGDRVTFTNDYGVKFDCAVTALYSPKEPCSLYALGYRYLLNTSSPWMPVAESQLTKIGG